MPARPTLALLPILIGLPPVLPGLALAGGPPRVQAPDAPWKTFHTAHYAIHFPAGGGFEPFAREVAAKVEGIHAQVTDWVGYAHPGRIHVLIRDPQMEANGSAWPFLERPWVELWKTPPEADSPIGHYASWVDLLVVHELAHVHHLIRPQNRPTWIDKLLDRPMGPVVRKAPRWVIEGYATLVEGRITGSGRPHGAFRAAHLRQWALQGKLPDYGQISGFGGFRGGNHAYLVGSAYLEWLERQNPKDPDILKAFWKQLASRKRRDFEAAFRATFGMGPRDGYDRWRAETTHDALALERQLKGQIREGELWARIPGEVTDLSVSPDGTRLLARTLTEGFRGLQVWDLNAAPPAPKAEVPDPNEVEDRAPEVPVRKARRIGRVEGALPRRPRWVDDQRVRFTLRQPTAEGVLEERTWELDLRTGARRPTAPAPNPSPGPFEATLGAPIWNLARREGGQPLTRTLSAAWNPTPTPDGKWLYYTQLTATGVDIRRLDLSLPPLAAAPIQKLAPEPALLNPDTVLPRADEPSRLPPPADPTPARDYRAGDSLWNRPRTGLSLGPSGRSYQVGYGGSDLLDRAAWLALASVGNGAGPRGATLAGLWRGWAWAPSLALFSSLERPSAQDFAPVQGFDRERRGAELAFTHTRHGRATLAFRPFIATERVALQEPPQLQQDRTLAGLGLSLQRGWPVTEKVAWSAASEFILASGRTEGEAWNLQRGRLRLHFANPHLPLTLAGEWARLGGRPTPLDQLHLGGQTTSLLPANLDLNRLDQAALPAHTARGDRAHRWRAELGRGLRAYLEQATVWTDGAPRPATIRVAGAELDLNALTPLATTFPLVGRIHVVLGLHRGLDGPMKDRTVGTLSWIVRP